MLHHRKNTRTKYEFAFMDKDGNIQYRFWMVSKSINKVQRMAIQYVNDIEKATSTDGTQWTFTEQGLINKTTGHVAKFTSNTLYGTRGYAK